MKSKPIDTKKLIEYWLSSSDDDFDTMMSMYQTKRYNWSLFIGHLMIEKLLKAYFVKVKSDYPPYSHNLLRIAEKAGMDLTDERVEQLITVTAFNINARYDDYKMSFKKRCTSAYTDEWIGNIKELRTWIKDLVVQ